MRVRSVGISMVAGLALAGGLAVGGGADERGGRGGGTGASGAVRPEPTGGAVRVARPLVGRTEREHARTRDPGATRVAFLKTRATPGTVRIAQRVKADGDRLPWALRTFERPRVTGGLASNVRADPSRPGIRCVQLGRVREGTFGWLVPGGAFRPLPATTDLLAVCATDATPRTPASYAVVVPDRHPYDADARAREAVVWGLAPPGAKALEVRWAGWTRTVPVRGGTFLAVGPAPRGSFVDRKARVRTPGARATPDEVPRPKGPPRQFSPQTAEDPKIAARLLDPTTGRPVVAVVGTVRGRPCDGGAVPLSAGVVGAVDPVPLVITGAGRQCQVVPIPERGGRPRLIGFGGGTGPAEGPDLVVQQRLVPGNFGITVLTPPDVVRVELRTPVDVRTVRAVPPGIVHALYDGSAFQSGGRLGSPDIEVVGVRANGSTVRGDDAMTGGPPVRLGTAELGGR